MMQEDGFHAAVATGSGIMLYGYTLDAILVVLWVAYVLLLIAKVLPDLPKKYPFIGRFWSWAWRTVRRK
ncbi:hypothetical protein H0A71_06140 [Alcaligenaceae bacterium]|nr:hypothetical protein [Alcaligenaceae bacterium]